MVKRKFVDVTSSSPTSKVSSNGNDDGAERSNGGGNLEEVKVHHVPFKLEYEGQANVDTKFTSKIKPFGNDDKVLCNQFRGRPLQGQNIDLPNGYLGLIASDLKKSSSDDDGETSEETEIAIVKKFDSMTYWNWDRIPSGMDKHIKLKDWIELSQILHEPIEN